MRRIKRGKDAGSPDCRRLSGLPRTQHPRRSAAARRARGVLRQPLRRSATALGPVDHDRERETGCDGSDTCQEIPHLCCSVPRGHPRNRLAPSGTGNSIGVRSNEGGTRMGLTDKVTGRAKKAAGDLVDDAGLKREGSQEERKGEAKDELSRAQERADDKADEVANLERKTN